jgi:hypothetical protein
MLYLEQLDEKGYLTRPQNALLLPRDVELLINRNPAYEGYKEWLDGWREALAPTYERRKPSVPESSVDVQLDEMQRRIFFLYGKSDPCSVLKLLAGVANDPDYLQSEMDLKGIDRSSILIKYLSSQLTLQEKDGQGKALGGLKEVVAMTEALQESPGGQGITFRANSLRWLKEKSLNGIDDAQPNCRRVLIGTEMDGPISEFGKRFLQVVIQTLENGEIPGTSMATEIIYSDRFVNTPFKVAILAKVIDAVIFHLKGLGRWADGVVNVHLGGLIEVKGNGAVNRSESFESSDERNKVVEQLLKAANVKPSIYEGKVPHQRSLIIRFQDRYELQIGIEKGMGTWQAIRSNWHSINGCSHKNTTVQKVAFLSGNSINVGLLEEGCPLFVEWYKK